jgi:hypothetical protein
MQMKYENHEIWQHVLTSHEEAMIKILEHFAKVVMYDSYKPTSLTSSRMWSQVRGVGS